MSSFRVIRTADIQPDNSLKGIIRHEGAAAERNRSATRSAFDGLISEAIDQKVAFVVIAGNLYDGNWKDFHAGLFFSHHKAATFVREAVGSGERQRPILIALYLWSVHALNRVVCHGDG